MAATGNYGRSKADISHGYLTGANLEGKLAAKMLKIGNLNVSRAIVVVVAHCNLLKYLWNMNCEHLHK